MNDASLRRVYPEFDADAAAFGREVAVYNAGFTAGWADAAQKASRGARWLQHLGALLPGSVWRKPGVRRAWERAAGALSHVEA